MTASNEGRTPNPAIPPRPRKLPRQRRSVQLVRAIREACVRILEEEGADRLTTQRIADVAGVNIASVYQYFPNKEAVLADVYEEQMACLSERAEQEFSRIQRLSEQSLEATLEAIIDLELELLSRLYSIHSDFYLQYRQSFDILRRVNDLALSLSNPSWESWFPQFLRRHRERLHPGDIDTMSFITRSSLDACLKAALVERPQTLRNSGFRRELLDLLLRYLLQPPIGSPIGSRGASLDWSTSNRDREP